MPRAGKAIITPRRNLSQNSLGVGMRQPLEEAVMEMNKMEVIPTKRESLGKGRREDGGVSTSQDVSIYTQK